jgi:hypothetical protein
MKTFLKTLSLAALVAVAFGPAQLFAQDSSTPTGPVPAQNNNTAQVQNNTTAPPFDQSQAPPPDQSQASPPEQSAPQGQPQDPKSVTFQTFYNKLSGMGTWFQVANYGYVWQPTENNSNWRPYTYGHWVNSNQGMTWVSDEPFGWATYHYGRWANLDNYGWVWVPGYTWAPAWVSWRNSDDNTDTSDDVVGWAPLPPDTFAGIDYAGPGFFDLGYDNGFGFHIGDDCDTVYGIGPSWYNFCPVAYLGDPAPWRHFADRRNNFAIINRTHNVTNVNVFNEGGGGRFGRVNAGGPDSATLARSHTPVRTVHLTAASSLAANGHRNGGSLAVYAPNVRANSATGARPQRVAGNFGTVAVNRGTDINRPLAVNSRVRGTTATPAQIQAATAGSSASAAPGIARTGTTFSRTLNQPLTSFRPAPTAGTNGRHENVAQSPVSATVHVPALTSHKSASAFTGESAVAHHATATPPHTAATSSSPSFFSSFFHSSNASGTAAPTSYTHSSSNPKPAYHSSVVPTFHSGAASSFHTSVAPSFHANPAPSFHPQSSFHASAPTTHFGGGGAPAAHFGGGAVAAHASGGGGGGGGHSGGGQHH